MRIYQAHCLDDASVVKTCSFCVDPDCHGKVMAEGGGDMFVANCGIRGQYGYAITILFQLTM